MGHLEDNGLTYFKHLKYSLNYASTSAKACVCFIIHAFLPDAFVTKGSETISKLNDNIKTTNIVLHNNNNNN